MASLPSRSLICCRTLCCVLIVFVNVISIIFGVLLAILGILILCGWSALQSVISVGLTAKNGLNVTAYSDGLSLENHFASLANLTAAAGGILIAVGVLIVAVSCFGCFGACIGIPACLIIYAVCIALVFVAQLTAVIIWFAQPSMYRQSIRDSLEQQISRYTGDGPSRSMDSAVLDVLQAMLGCCGGQNGTDFRVLSGLWNRTYSMVGKDNKTFTFNLNYPVSCCKYNMNTYQLEDPYCPYNGSSNAMVSNYQTGCSDKVWLTVKTHLQLDKFFYALCGCLGLEILLIIGAIIICVAKRREHALMVATHGEVEYKMVQQKS